MLLLTARAGHRRPSSRVSGSCSGCQLAGGARRRSRSSTGRRGCGGQACIARPAERLRGAAGPTAAKRRLADKLSVPEARSNTQRETAPNHFFTSFGGAQRRAEKCAAQAPASMCCALGQLNGRCPVWLALGQPPQRRGRRCAPASPAQAKTSVSAAAHPIRPRGPQASKSTAPSYLGQESQTSVRITIVELVLNAPHALPKQRRAAAHAALDGRDARGILSLSGKLLLQHHTPVPAPRSTVLAGARERVMQNKEGTHELPSSPACSWLRGGSEWRTHSSSCPLPTAQDLLLEKSLPLQARSG